VPHENSNKPLYEFVLSVDEIEKMTGIDFYPNLSDEIENQLESQSDIKNGVFNYHSFTLLASNLMKIKSKIVNAHKLEPPYEKKGSGTPIVGNNLINMAIFTKKCVNK
jgi:hypothetical protein